MELLSILGPVFARTDRLVAAADEKMNIIWSNREGEPKNFSPDKLRLPDSSELPLPVTSSAVAQYCDGFSAPAAVEITVLENCGEAKYLIQFYTCEDIERLSDRSEHLLFRTNYLGNIRSELSQIVCMLDANRQKYVQAGDLEYLRFDSEARYRILKSFSATANQSELTKYFSGYYKIDSISVSDIVGDLCAEVGELFEKDGCKFRSEIEPLIYVRSNADRLRAAVCNLLINAFMYNSSPQKECVLKLYCTDSEIVLSVQDNGSGVSAAELEGYKTPFGRFRGYAERESLGIAVACCFCKSLGGDLRFVCGEGAGTRAEMVLPKPEGSLPLEFRAFHVAPINSPFDLQYCILAKGIDPIK